MSPLPVPEFDPLRDRRRRHAHTGTADAVIVGRARPISFIAALPAAERARLAAAVRALIAGTPARAGRATADCPCVTTASSRARA